MMFLAHHTPPLSLMLDDLTTKDPARIAKHLGITPKTLARWKALDDAPRAVLLALFFETRWGSSLIHSTAVNGRMYAEQMISGLNSENAMLRARIARLEKIGDFGAANAPRLTAWN